MNSRKLLPTLVKNINTLPSRFSAETLNQKLSTWMQKYEEFVGLSEVKAAQSRVLEVLLLIEKTEAGFLILNISFRQKKNLLNHKMRGEKHSGRSAPSSRSCMSYMLSWIGYQEEMINISLSSLRYLKNRLCCTYQH